MKYEGIKIRCLGCNGEYHETTDKYDPTRPANGAMFRMLEPWAFYGWSTFPNTECQQAADIACPDCGNPYLDGSGSVEGIVLPKTKAYDCACGASYKHQASLVRHRKNCNDKGK